MYFPNGSFPREKWKFIAFSKEEHERKIETFVQG